MNRLIQTESSNSVGFFNFVKICFSILFETLTTKKPTQEASSPLKISISSIRFSLYYPDATKTTLLMDCYNPNQSSVIRSQIRLLNQKLFFLLLKQNICCGYSKEPPH